MRLGSSGHEESPPTPGHDRPSPPKSQDEDLGAHGCISFAGGSGPISSGYPGGPEKGCRERSAAEKRAHVAPHGSARTQRMMRRKP